MEIFVKDIFKNCIGMEEILIMKNVKKAISAFLIVAMTVTLLFQNTAIAQGTQENGNTEIPEGYTPIYTIADLVGINSNPSGNYILMNDIDMTKETSPGGSWDTGHGWTPLDKFSGTFDGNGHRIIGMHIYGEYKLTYNSLYLGLFSRLEDGALIQNLGITDCDIKVTGSVEDHCIGGIAGYSDGTVDRCYVNGVIENNLESYYSGDVGGFIGAGSNLIIDSYNMAKISVSEDSHVEVGGIVGRANGTGTEITNCYNLGAINQFCQWQTAGAIAGEYGRISNSYYLNTTASIGCGDSSVDFDCKALTDAQMRYPTSFTGFDFKNTWVIDELSSYPYPQLRSCPQVRVEKLELTSLPNKVTYSQGDKLDLSGAVIAITYEDGVVTSTEVDSSMISGVDMNSAGTQTAVVTYINETCTFDITVNAVEASGITLSKEECTLNRNSKLQLNATVTPSNAVNKSVTWESNNEAVATVTKNGVVHGLNAGEATITATTSNGLTASCTVTVKVPATSIKLNSTKFTLKKGKKKTLKATVNPLETTDTVKWTSSNSKIASVTQKGVVKAKKKGYATIMAKTSSGKTASAKVTVK